MKELVFLSLGSNLGDRKRHLKKAIRLLEEQAGEVGKVSDFYESQSWGFSSKNNFCNCCITFHTSLEALSLMDVILGIELEMGRIRVPSREAGAAYTDRIIDIDMLFYGDLCMHHPRLILPHPSLADRRFVLVPLNEIATRFKHPVNNLTIGQMLQACKDKGKVWSLDE